MPAFASGSAGGGGGVGWPLSQLPTRRTTGAPASGGGGEEGEGGDAEPLALRLGNYLNSPPWSALIGFVSLRKVPSRSASGSSGFLFATSDHGPGLFACR